MSNKIHKVNATMNIMDLYDDAMAAAKEFHSVNKSFDKSTGAVKRAAYNYLDAIDRMPAFANKEGIYNELDVSDVDAIERYAREAA